MDNANTPAPAAAAPEQQSADAKSAATAAGAERARVKGILCHAEAKGRAGLAEHLAYDTDMSVEQAAGCWLLAAAPREQDARLDADTALDRLMANEQQPNVDAAAGADKPNKAQAIASAWSKATGAKLQ